MTRSLMVFFLAFAGIWASACGSDETKAPPIKKCTLNSDCDSDLVCGFGLCHAACRATKDCAPGQRCVKADVTSDSGVCQIDQEAECSFTSDCPNPLVCGPDSECRTPCRYPSARDCLPGQVCAKGNVCADPGEVDDSTGNIKGAPPVTDAGGTGGGSGTGGRGNRPDGGDCVQGADCTPDGSECKKGTVSCANGQSTCTEAGTADDGTACGTDRVCQSGTCTDCVQDGSCTDTTNPCKTGTQSCTGGVQCLPGASAKNGSACGDGKVCVDGDCTACVVGEACTPKNADACKEGKRTCDDGPACVATGDADDGKSCGSDRVCTDGACKSCFDGSSCTPDNECHKGILSCSTGGTCTDTSAKVNDGKPCATAGQYCVDGACKACTQGDPCTPTEAPCKTGYTYCSGGQATCSAQGTNAADGKLCNGDTSACFAGVCTPLDRTIVVKSGGTPTGKVDQFATTNVVVTIKDKNGAGVPNIQVTVLDTEPPGGFGIPTVTNASGDSTVQVRLGRAVGSYKFKVTGTAVLKPVEFTATATAPTNGTVFSIINADHLSGTTAPGAGTAVRTQQTQGMTLAADGTLYAADYYSVYKLTPQGQLTIFAGKPGTYGDLGDGGKASEARFYGIKALALDEKNGFLYIADNGTPNRVRYVDLKTNIVGTYAGGGSATASPWGSPGPANNQVFSGITNLALSPAGDLYITDTNHARIVKVDADGNSDDWRRAVTCPAGAPTTLNSVGSGASMAWDASGKMFLSASFCNLGNDPTKQFNAIGVVRVEADGSYTHVAGFNGAGSSDGIPSTSVNFNTTPHIAFDKAGYLYTAHSGDDLVRRIDPATFKISTVGGMALGSTRVFKDYGPATETNFYGIDELAFDGANNLYVVDSNDYSLRAIWNVGLTTAPTYTFAINGGTAQTAIPVDGQFAALSVKLTDAAAANITNVPVFWQRKAGETGSYIAQSVVNTTPTGGISAVTGRVGLLPGPYNFQASYADLHGNATTRTFTVTAVAPAAGTIFSAVNVANLNQTDGVPGPGTAAHTSYPADVVSAADGTLYLAASYGIYKLTPQGEISLYAGSVNSYGNQGDLGPRLDARFSTLGGLALDETNKLLYVSDSGNNRVRVIDMTTGIVAPVAGSAPDTADPNFGNGPSGEKAYFSGLGYITLSLDKKTLYAIDTNHNRIRAIDVDSTAVSNYFALDATSCATQTPVKVTLASIVRYSKVIFLANGDAYISGNLCGSLPGNGNGNARPLGIVRRTPAGVFSHIAGFNSSTSTSDGIAATTAYIPDLGGLAMDSAGNLVISSTSGQKIRKIVPGGAITTIAGTGTYTVTHPAADYVAGTASTFYNPYGLAFYKGGASNPGDHLVISDSSDFAWRVLW